MTIVVVLVLCGVWAAYLVPPMLRDRGVGFRRGAGHGLSAIGSAASRVLSDSRPADSQPAGSSPAHLAPQPSRRREQISLMPSSTAAARQRRVVVLGVLAALAVVSLLAVPVFGPPALVLNLGLDVLLGAMGYFTYKRSMAPRSAPVVRSLDFHRQVQRQRNEPVGVQMSENELARRIAN